MALVKYMNCIVLLIEPVKRYSPLKCVCWISVAFVWRLQESLDRLFLHVVRF